LQRIPHLQDTLIPRLESPVVDALQAPVSRGLALPVFQAPDPSIKYPVINVPTQEEFDAAVKADRDKAAQEDAAKNRGLPDSKPELPPAVQALTQTPPEIKAEIPADNPTINVAGVKIDLPDPSLVATAGAVAVVTTAATMASTAVLNVLKNAAEPMIREASKNKFKIKIKQVKPVLHYVLGEDGRVDIFEYSAEGTRLVAQTDNVEQYIRDQVDTNALYEIENKVIIDDSMKTKFTKEGQERFKGLYAPAKKIAKKLSARIAL
jgi:hypothetical protein